MIDCDRGADSFGATRAIVSSAIRPIASAAPDRRRARSLATIKRETGAFARLLILPTITSFADM